jgi:serine/threonine protein phosphatase 1
LAGSSESPPLGFPADARDRVRIPDDWTVWTFSDVHGVLSAFRDALVDAGRMASSGSWVGGARVALVGVGDYIDRGRASAGIIDLLRRLAPKMERAGSRLVLVRGNHEQMLADVLRGADEWFATWFEHGGNWTTWSFGSPRADLTGDEVRRLLGSGKRAPLEWLLDTLPYALWRDVLFVHTAPVAWVGLPELLGHDAQMWEVREFNASDGIRAEPSYASYRLAGIRRVVVGHQPRSAEPQLLHNGATLLIDTNAPSMPSGLKNRPGAVTILRLPDGTEFDQLQGAVVPTLTAPDHMPIPLGRVTLGR